MDHCGTWTSSYRLVLGLLEEVDETPYFGRKALFELDGQSLDEANSDALWDVVFARMSAIQEYGWHAGLEPLIWATDAVNGSLEQLNWPGLQVELSGLRDEWIRMIISHAKSHDGFFPKPELEEEDNDG
jgi:hypothetical protein